MTSHTHAPSLPIPPSLSPIDVRINSEVNTKARADNVNMPLLGQRSLVLHTVLTLHRPALAPCVWQRELHPEPNLTRTGIKGAGHVV